MEISLNLIPEYRKEEIERAKRHRVFIWQIVAGLFMMLVFGSILVGFNLELTTELDAIVQTSIPKDQIKDFEELKKYDEEFKEANDRIAVLEGIQKEEIFWSNLFLELDKIISDGVEIKSVSTKKMQVFISGTTGTRDDLVAFKNKLEEAACFENVNFPLSNFAAKDNIEFQLDFFIKDNCVKKK